MSFAYLGEGSCGSNVVSNFNVLLRDLTCITDALLSSFRERTSIPLLKMWKMHIQSPFSLKVCDYLPFYISYSESVFVVFV